MLLINWDSVHIHAFLEPPFIVSKLHIIPTHLSLSHPAIFGKGPVFKAIGSPPLAGFVVPLIPELHCNLSRSAVEPVFGDWRAASNMAALAKQAYLVVRESKQLFP